MDEHPTEPVPPELAGVDLRTLDAWLVEAGVGPGPITAATPLTGGTQNRLLRIERDGRALVVRLPPPHKRANSDETLRREARVLGALAGTDVPHPELVAACPDLEPLGAAFTVMEAVDGFNPSEGLPEPHRSDPAMRHAMGCSHVDAVASLGCVDHVAVGLADFGKAEGWLERQVPRWQHQLDTYAELDGYPGPDIPGLDRVQTWLADNQPASWQPGIIHGDCHLGNVLIRRDRGEVAALVDWELATIGDPLLDLGHLLATWPDASGGGIGAGVTDLPDPAEVVARYLVRTGRDAAVVPWFHVLAAYRLGIILEGTHARAFAGKAPKEIGDLLHATTVGLFARAVAAIEAAG